MSTPICSRCQKIYTSGSAPVKCTNCGGNIRITRVAAQATKQTSTKESILPTNPLAGDSPRTVDRLCHKAGCHSKASHSIKYFIEGKVVVMAPASDVREKKAKDFCVHHAREFVAPETWTLVHKDRISEHTRGEGESNSSDESGGFLDSIISFLGSLIVIVLSVIFFAIVAVVGLFVIYMVFEFFVGLGSSETRPIKVPFRWRK